ncbi:MAG TPA: alpha/beta hydrolase [Steroidobacteraceae bacterium]|jgi:pimeloyl-ACP methyl ester carboxylesterase|nr:alpha/beta hydrolase [Steroidobacteraceae bacterium]
MTNWMTGICETAEATLHYVRTGGAGPPLILLHGLTGNGACWRPLARVFESEFDLVMPDARGHGRSSTPPSGYRYEDHCRDVVGLIRALGLQSPVLLGHSMGGMTATVVAGQLGDAVGGLIVADPTFLSPERQREVYDSDAVEQHRRLLSQSRDAQIADLRIRHPRRSLEMVELLAEARSQTRLNAFDVLIPLNPDYRQLVGALRAPILLVIGDRPVVSIETARELQSLNPRVQIEQIADAGHGLPYDQPEKLAAVVSCFLRSVAARRSRQRAP